MDGWVDRWMCGWMGCVSFWMDGVDSFGIWVDLDGCYGWIYGWDGGYDTVYDDIMLIWMFRWMDGWMDWMAAFDMDMDMDMDYTTLRTTTILHGKPAIVSYHGFSYEWTVDLIREISEKEIGILNKLTVHGDPIVEYVFK